MKVTSVTVGTTKFAFGMCNCTVGSGCWQGRLSARAGNVARVWARANTIARVSGYGLREW